MPESTLDSLVDVLRRKRLLEPKQLDDITRALQTRSPEPRALGQALLKRGWLTPFQVKLLLEGRGDDLVLGGYLILDQLGEGGMGAVYKARHRGLGRTVALKVIRKDRLTNTDAVRRFQREIRAASQLTHPNVVLAFDADQAGDTHFFAMEYVEGTDLGHLVKERGRLPVGLACDYIRQAALGLQHAHEKGLVHRDIKPANLLLTKAGQVKVLDLGLSRVHQEQASQTIDATLTQTGSVMGTPDYMAPEQARDSHTVDVRADIYSLGCTLYQMLTGTVPFPGGTGMEKVFKHQLEEAPAVEQLRPEVSAGLARVVRRLMAKQPQDRYQTPAEVAAALQPFCGAASMGNSADTLTEVMASAPTTPPRPRRRRGRPLLFAGIALMMLSGAGVLAFLLSGPGSLAVVPPVTEPASKPMERPPTVRDIGNPIAVPIGTPIEIPNGQPVMSPPGVVTMGEANWRTWGPTLAVAYSPNGEAIAAAGSDTAVRIFPVASGKEVVALRGPTKVVHALAFSPNSKVLAAAGADRNVYVWDLNTGQPIVLKGHTGEVYALAFSPDSQTLATASNDQTIRLWNMAPRSGDPVILQDTQPLGSIAFSPDGKTLASGSRMGRKSTPVVRLWNVADRSSRIVYTAETNYGILVAFAPLSGLLVHTESPKVGVPMSILRVRDIVKQEDRQIVTYPTAIRALAFSAKSDLLAVAFGDEIRLRSLGNQVEGVAAGKAPGLTALAFAPDGQSLVTGHFDQRLRLWDAANGLKASPTGGTLVSLLYAPDGKSIATLSNGMAGDLVRIWDVASRHPTAELQTRIAGSSTLAFSADGRVVATGGAGGMSLWNVATKQAILSVEEPNGAGRVVAAPALGRIGLLFGQDKARTYDFQTGQFQTETVMKEGICSAAVTPDGKRTAIGCADRVVRLADVQKGDALTSLQGHTGPVGSVAFSPDGKLLASAAVTNDGSPPELKLWEMPQGRELRTFPGQAVGIQSIEFSADGKRLLLTGYQIVRVLDLDTGKEWDPLLGRAKEQAETFAAALAPDGQTLATAGPDGLVTWWDIASHKKRWEHKAAGPVRAVTFAPDGLALAAANGNGTVSLFRVGTKLEAIPWNPAKFEKLPDEHKLIRPMTGARFEKKLGVNPRPE